VQSLSCFANRDAMAMPLMETRLRRRNDFGLCSREALQATPLLSPAIVTAIIAGILAPGAG
jgi:hypothetical protein